MTFLPCIIFIRLFLQKEKKNHRLDHVEVSVKTPSQQNKSYRLAKGPFIIHRNDALVSTWFVSQLLNPKRERKIDGDYFSLPFNKRYIYIYIYT